MARRRSSLFFLLLSSFLQSTVRADKFLVNTQKNRIVDTAGRERIFHGQNVVMKTAPFIPITDHFDARFGKLTRPCSSTDAAVKMLLFHRDAIAFLFP